jgi:PAS domain S-box-containing protein
VSGSEDYSWEPAELVAARARIAELERQLSLQPGLHQVTQEAQRQTQARQLEDLAHREQTQVRHREDLAHREQTQVRHLEDRAHREQTQTRHLEDLAHREQTEAALLESTQRLQLAVQGSHVAVWDWNLRTNGMVWDDEMRRLYGVSPQQFTGTIDAWKSGLYPADRERALADCQAALDGVRDFDTEFRVVRPDGTVRHVQAIGLVLREGKTPVRMLGVNLDITERKRAEEDYRSLFHAMLNGFALHEIICDDAGRPVDYRFLAVNPAFERMTGLKAAALVGRTVMEVMPATEQHWIENYGQVALTGTPGAFENYSAELRKHFEVTAYRPAPRQFACIIADITARKSAEEERARLEGQLRQAQRLEAVGRLAGGVAHDFNNMLGVIIGHAEMALEAPTPSDELRSDLEEIREAARRSAELTRQLLAFARKQTVAPQVLDLNQSVDGMLKMLKRLIGEHIDLAWKPAEGLWPVKLDPTQVDQVLANLCVNARDAISAVGTLTIETGNVTLDERHCDANPGSVPGDYVQLVVTDDGRGMDELTLSHLFEPFFTTKALGDGTGLGLATVYGIVNQNDGLITVDSKPGHGATFRIFLPRHEGEVDPSRASGPGPALRGSETILLVEDEASILRMTTRMLQRLGYTVLAAATPAEALRWAREHGARIDLLMTDVVMPGMNGASLARELVSCVPSLRWLYMSGYTADVIGRQGVLDEGVHFLQKPFSAEELATRVRGALDGPSKQLH